MKVKLIEGGLISSLLRVVSLALLDVDVKKRIIYLREKNHHSFAVISKKTRIPIELVRLVWRLHKYSQEV